jgi:hypothetical protein
MALAFWMCVHSLRLSSLLVFFLSYIRSTHEKVGLLLWWNEIDVETSTDLHVFSPSPKYEKVVFGMPSPCKHVCMYVCMRTSLAPQRLDEFYSYLVFKSLYLIGRFSLNTNILTPKVWALIEASKHKFSIFSKWNWIAEEQRCVH